MASSSIRAAGRSRGRGGARNLRAVLQHKTAKHGGSSIGAAGHRRGCGGGSKCYVCGKLFINLVAVLQHKIDKHHLPV